MAFVQINLRRQQMTCELETETNDYFSGTSLYSKPYSHCLKETSVYLPPAHDNAKNLLNVVIWLHGFYVPNNRALFKTDDVNVRQRVLSCSRDVVLIAPHLGHGYFQGGAAAGTFSTGALGQGKWGEKYLMDVLGGLAQYINPKSPPQLDIKNLILACHSGGGTAMRGLVGTLGKFGSRLRECWGFDCLYGRNANPDDAVFWFHQGTGAAACPLYVWFGDSTIPMSVKLYLMAKGMADDKGNEINPPCPSYSEIHVAAGHYDAFPMAGQMVNVGSKVDAFSESLITQAPGAKTKGKQLDGAYVARAAANFDSKFAFSPGIHYTIARKYFSERLGAVALP
jgi:hypothetical protein